MHVASVGLIALYLGVLNPHAAGMKTTNSSAKTAGKCGGVRVLMHDISRPLHKPHNRTPNVRASIRVYA